MFIRAPDDVHVALCLVCWLICFIWKISSLPKVTSRVKDLGRSRFSPHILQQVGWRWQSLSHLHSFIVSSASGKATRSANVNSSCALAQCAGGRQIINPPVFIYLCAFTIDRDWAWERKPAFHSSPVLMSWCCEEGIPAAVHEIVTSNA